MRNRVAVAAAIIPATHSSVQLPLRFEYVKKGVYALEGTHSIWIRHVVGEGWRINYGVQSLGGAGTRLRGTLCEAVKLANHFVGAGISAWFDELHRKVNEKVRESERIYEEALARDEAVKILAGMIKNGPPINDDLAAEALASRLVEAGWRKVS